MQPIKLIVIGKMGSGKEVAAKYLQKNGALRFTRSELMKMVCHALIDHVGSLDDYLERLFPGDLAIQDKLRNDLLKYAAQYAREKGKPRKLYQEVTDIVLSYDPFVYEKELADRIENLKPQTAQPFYLIDDAREHAYEFFTQLGYKSLRIDAPVEVRKLRMYRRDGFLPSPETFNHVSETLLDSVETDYTVDNGEDNPEKLYAQLDEVIRQLKDS